MMRIIAIFTIGFIVLVGVWFLWGRQTDMAFQTLTGEPPIIIAHRGASGYLPEHTLEAYRRAVELGADYIEPDLVITKDGVLVARHDSYLSTTTDVADHPEFAERKRYDQDFDRTDWWVSDFTLEELKTLKARQPFANRDKSFDGQFDIPTFDEILVLLISLREETGRDIGIYPETKHPDAFAAMGLDFEGPLLSSLERFGLNHAGARVFIQSFEDGILKSLNQKTDIPLIFLIEGLEDKQFPDFSAIARYADGVGPYKGLLWQEGRGDTGFVDAAHTAGLQVHPWTFRDDQLPEGFTSPIAEMHTYFDLGIDGLFTDFADTGVAARQRYNPAKRPSR